MAHGPHRYRIIFFTLALVALASWASAAPFTVGNVFASVGNGLVREYTPTGTLVQTLNHGHGGFTTGSAFDAAGNFYVTGFGNNAVYKFDHNGTFVGTFGSGFNADPESILFDKAGNAYVGQADGAHNILKFDAAGNPLGSFAAASEDRGTDWIDLSADQKTMFYTSEGTLVKRFDVSTNTQLADFANLGQRPAFALRILADGGVLVADSASVKRLDSAGVIIQNYAVGNGNLFALNLDPDGKTFWTGDFGNGFVYHLDIATGNLIGSFSTGAPGNLFGLSVFGEITEGGPGNPVPEPATLLTLGLGLAATVRKLRRR